MYLTDAKQELDRCPKKYISETQFRYMYFLSCGSEYRVRGSEEPDEQDRNKNKDKILNLHVNRIGADHESTVRTDFYEPNFCCRKQVMPPRINPAAAPINETSNSAVISVSPVSGSLPGIEERRYHVFYRG